MTGTSERERKRGLSPMGAEGVRDGNRGTGSTSCGPGTSWLILEE